MSSLLLDYRERPIPLLDGKRKIRTQGIMGVAEGGYRTHPYDIGHPAANEPLVNVLGHPYNLAGDNYYNRQVNTIYGGRIEGSIPELLMRKGVAERLFAVNKRLQAEGLELYLFDAWRPLEVQQNARGMFESRLRKNYPDWSDERVLKLVNTFWAVPPSGYDEINPYSPPPHMSGAVSDLSLRVVSTKQLLEMGSTFDDVDITAFPDWAERVCRAKLAAGKLPSYTAELARDSRRILYWVMEDSGISVNATEIWHVSQGDQLDSRYKTTPDNLVRARYPLIRP